MRVFDYRLQEGLDIERECLKIIQRKYPCAVMVEGNFSDYDIWIPERNKSVEVKSCPRCHEFGNVVIEFEMYGKRSALLISKADWWVIYDGKKFQMMTKDDILHCIFMNKLTYKEIRGDSAGYMGEEGDTSLKKCFLVPVDKLLTYGEELK